MIIYIILINHKIWSVALLILIVFFDLAQCCEIGGHLRSIVLPSDAMLCNNRNRKWVLRHFLPFHQVVQSLHGGRHLGTTGTTRLKTNALYYYQLPPVVVKICGIQWQRLNIQWQRLEKTNFVNFLDGKSMEKNSENKPNSFNGEKRELRIF